MFDGVVATPVVTLYTRLVLRLRGIYPRCLGSEYAPDAASRVWSNAGYAFASTVVRAGVWQCTTHSDQTSFIAS